jgi:hypothetical protein
LTNIVTDAFVGAGTAGLVKGGGAVVSNIAKKAAPKVANAVGRIRSLSSEKIFQKQYKALGQAARKASPCNCFGKGTLVWTATGPRPIEELRVGDQVLSWSEETGEIALKAVTETFVTPDRPLLDLVVTGATISEVITTTPGHPFWVEGTGWVHAAELTRGDILRLVEVSALDLGSTLGGAARGPGEDYYGHRPARGTVYNLTVADFHTYFVGNGGVLVHNSSPCQTARFISQPDGTLVDTAATPRGSYKQPNGGRTDILQGEDHGAGLSHTHDPKLNVNPKTGQTFFNGLQKPGRPVSADDVANIRSGAATTAEPKGR